MADCAAKIKNENLDFEVIAIEKTKAFQSKIIPQNLINNFLFNYKVYYFELYKDVESSDYIILLFNSKRKFYNKYKHFIVTGNIQLIYGFFKPAIIHNGFSNFYYLNNENSLIYNNLNLYDI